MNAPEIVTAEQLAVFFQLKPETVLRWARDGKVPSIKVSPKVVRFDKQAVLTALGIGASP